MQATEATAQSAESLGEPPAWPASVDLFGIPVTPTTYEEAARAILEATSQGLPGVVSCHAVHAIVTTSRDDALREMVGSFDMITPDGQPVRWALNLLHATKLRDRVYGPDLMLALCQRAAEQGVSVYLYGGSPEVAEKLQANLRAKYPQLKIAGYESPPFRPLAAEEDEQVVERINSSGAGLVFIGLGCPKQDIFAFEHRNRINAVQLCVGAAFDFHAGMKKSAPGWMQQHGLEWLFRLLQEPRRLWKRYLITNTLFVWMVVRAWLAAKATRIVRKITRLFKTGASS
jgi:N-acetylglucosaminyldiphosphoundecaprenol N-acetyl-beta-D-mannosaminyltransferase